MWKLFYFRMIFFLELILNDSYCTTYYKYLIPLPCIFFHFTCKNILNRRVHFKSISDVKVQFLYVTFLYSKKIVISFKKKKYKYLVLYITFKLNFSFKFYIKKEEFNIFSVFLVFCKTCLAVKVSFYLASLILTRDIYSKFMRIR